MLLSIKINGKEVVLKNDFSFSMTRENPIFNDPETLSGDYIESITFPMNGNRDIFQNMHRITSSIRDVEYDISIFYNNYHLTSGTYTVKKAGQDYITGDAKLNALSFFNKIKDLKLSDIPDTEMFHLGNTNTAVRNKINSITTNSPQNIPFRFPPLFNPDFFDDNEYFDYEGIINEITTVGSAGTHVFNRVENNFPIIVPYVPCFFIEYLIKTLAKAQLYNIEIPDIPLLHKLILCSNKSLDKKIETNIYNELFLLLSSSEVSTGMGQWLILSHTVGFPSQNFVLLTDTVIKTKKTGTYRISIVGRLINNSLISINYRQKLRIIKNNDEVNFIELKNNDSIELAINDTIKIYGFIPWDGFSISANIGIRENVDADYNFVNDVYTAKHVPEIPQIELFTVLKGLFNVGFYADDMTHTIEMITFNEIIAKPPQPLDIRLSTEWNIDKTEKGFELMYENSYEEKEHPEKIDYPDIATIEDLPINAEYGEYAFVRNEANIYFYDEDEEGWSHFNIWNKEHIIEKDDMVSFSIPVNLPVMTQNGNDDFEFNYLMPTTEGKGNSFLNKKTDSDDYSIAIYMGLGHINTFIDQWAGYAAFASITRYDGKGNIHLSKEYSLLLDDVEKNFYQSFIHFLQRSRELSFRTKMKISDFAKLRLQEKYTAAGYTFIIKSMKITINAYDYSLVEMTVAVI